MLQLLSIYRHRRVWIFLIASAFFALLPAPALPSSTPARIVRSLTGAAEGERAAVRSVSPPPAAARVFGEAARKVDFTASVPAPRAGGVLGGTPAPRQPLATPGSPGQRQLRVGPRFQAQVAPTPRQREFNRVVYPTNNGFVGKPGRKTFAPGTVIDRFGGSLGTYASPVGTPKAQRALPPASSPRPYTAYVVEKPLRVKAGKVAPNFNQPGGGVQYQFIKKMKHMRDDMVEYLKDNGFLRPATPKDRHFLRGNFGAQSR